MALSRSSSKSKRSAFKYQERSADNVKEHAEQKGGKFDSIWKGNVDTYRPKEGDNCVRFLPPTWDDPKHWAYEVWVHRNVGPDNSTYLCPRKMLQKPCPICDAAEEAKNAGEEDEEKALRVQKTYAAWVIDREDKSDAPLIWHYSWSMDRDIAALCWNKKSGAVLLIDHPEEGYDLSFKRQGVALRTKYFGYQIDRDPTPILDDEKDQDQALEFITENPIPNLFNFFDTAYLQNVVEGKVEEKDPDKEEEDRPKRRRARKDEEEEEEPKSRRRSSRKDEEEEEEEPQIRKRPESRRAPDDEEEEEERPARRRRSEPEEEEEPKSRRRRSEPEEEEEEKPARRRRAKDEEEEEPEEKSRRRRSREEEEEEEEAPRRRRRSEPEEEEEERPSRRRRADPEEEEEEPKSRRRSSRKDEEEEEEPRSRRRR